MRARIPGPIEPKLSGKTCVIAGQTSGQSMPSSTTAAVIYNVVTTNTNNGYNSTTGIFTASQAGVYHVEASAFTASVAWSAGNFIDMYIRKNGVHIKRVRVHIQAAITNSLLANCECICVLNSGDTLDIALHNSRAAATTLFPEAEWNVLNIRMH